MFQHLEPKVLLWSPVVFNLSVEQISFVPPRFPKKHFTFGNTFDSRSWCEKLYNNPNLDVEREEP